MVARFSIENSWIVKVADAIARRNSVPLRDCIEKAQVGQAAILLDSSNESINGLIDSLYEGIGSSMQQFLLSSPSPNRNQSHSASSDHDCDSLNEKERQHLTEAVVRVAVTGALACFQKKNSVFFKSESSEMDREDLTEEDLVSQTVHNTLLKGLLYAFNAFQEVHSMARTHYPARQGSSTKGTVGWDTFILLYFVHQIPLIARKSSGSVVDDASGELIRRWRKLLIAVQGADPHEAPAHSRRRGALSIVNGLLSILFSRYNTHQCNVLVSAVEHSEKSAGGQRSILQPSKHITSEVVTYFYIKGRLALYGRRFDEALSCLRHAYSLLPRFSHVNEEQCKNKFRVRFYMCIAALLVGVQIPQVVLDEDNILLPIVLPITESIRRGDSLGLYLALETFSSTFRRRGVYLLLQQCRPLCMLMLLVRVHSCMAQLEIDNSRIPLSVLLAAEQVVVSEGIEHRKKTSASITGKKKELDEELIHSHTQTSNSLAVSLSTIIGKGFIRGYISYEHQILVLSKAQPFPTLTQASALASRQP